MKKIEILRTNEKYEEIINLTREYLVIIIMILMLIYRAMAYEAMGKLKNGDGFKKNTQG